MAAYRHIFFDLDHTLWDFDTNARHTLTDLFSEFSLGDRVTPYFDDFYTKYIYHNQVLWDRFQKGFISADELKWKRMWRTLLEFKVGDEKLARDLSGRFLELLPTKKEVFPYAKEILQYLQQNGYELHLITNGFEKTQWSKLRNTGLDQYFNEVITSEASNAIKPDAAIFAYALTKAGAKLEESIMVGDNIEADIKGAINAGMDSIYVNHIDVAPTVTPTFMVTHLSELEKIF